MISLYTMEPIMTLYFEYLVRIYQKQQLFVIFDKRLRNKGKKIFALQFDLQFPNLAV